MKNTAEDYLKGLQNGTLNGDAIEKVLEAGYITNSNFGNINAASLDIAITDKILTFFDSEIEVFDPFDIDLVDDIDISSSTPNETYITPDEKNEIKIPPKGFFLASSLERFHFPDFLVATVHTRSSSGRLFLDHLNSGFIDPGFKNSDLTLEFINHNTVPFFLKPFSKLVQIRIEKITPVSSKYSYDTKGRYNNSVGIVTSKGL